MKKSKILLLVIGSLFALVLVTMLLLHAFLPGIFSEKIEEKIRTALSPESIDLYEVNAGTSSFSTLFQTTIISSIRIIPKAIAFSEKDAGLLPNQIFETEVHNLSISSVTLISLALGRKNVKVNRFSTDSIFLVVYTNEAGKKESNSAQSNKMEQLSLKNICTGKLRIEQQSVADTSRQVLQTGAVDFGAVINFYDEGQNYFLNPGITELSLRILDATTFSSTGLYSFRIDSISFDGNGQTTELTGLKVIPRYSKQEFYKHLQFQTDRFDIGINHIKISGFKPDEFIQDGAIVISEIEMNGGNVEVFRDRKAPFNEQQRPVMPVSLIQNADFGLFAGKILFNDFDIVYAELPADSDSEGKIPFEQLSAVISNISNLKDSLASDSSMTIHAEALIFGESTLSAEFKYSLTDSTGTYEAKGRLAALAFKVINTAVYPLTGVKIKAGMHQNSSFHFYGNDVRSVGELRLKYSDLEVELIPDGRKVFQGIVGFAGRKALYHPSNPGKNDELRIGRIEFERDVSRFVFNYWWKSYLSGIKNSVLRDLVK
ncbi:MAG: hypothetical protein IH597_11060 [Bacteroidales bacterium]|nr:hypothetical protein [Bacteroidales bacterium]